MTRRWLTEAEQWLADKENATRLGLKHVNIHFGMFDFSCCCVIGPLGAGCKFAAWRLQDEEVEALSQTEDQGYVAAGRVFHRAGYVPVLWLPRKPRTARDHGILAHEMLHVVRHLMLWAHIPMSDASEEVWCHALTHGVTKLLEALSPSPPKPKAKRKAR